VATFEICSRERVQYVIAHLTGDTIMTEAGALRYYRGDIRMEVKAPSIGGIFKAAVTSESIVKPKYSGTGIVVLEPSLGNFFELTLDGSVDYVLDRGAYVASEATVNVEVKRNAVLTGIVGGEGLFQTWVTGRGKVIVAAPGPVEVLDLEEERLAVDGTFAVARDSRLSYRVERAARSMLGSAASGEGLINMFEGTGRVYLAPIPNYELMRGGAPATP
jgi:uncharacterized protein (AIM24 family)